MMYNKCFSIVLICMFYFTYGYLSGETYVLTKYEPIQIKNMTIYHEIMSYDIDKHSVIYVPTISSFCTNNDKMYPYLNIQTFFGGSITISSHHIIGFSILHNYDNKPLFDLAFSAKKNMSLFTNLLSKEKISAINNLNMTGLCNVHTKTNNFFITNDPYNNPSMYLISTVDLVTNEQYYEYL